MKLLIVALKERIVQLDITRNRINKAKMETSGFIAIKENVLEIIKKDTLLLERVLEALAELPGINENDSKA